MAVETRIPGRTREIERQRFAESLQILQKSGAIGLVTEIANTLRGVGLELRKEFNEDQPGLTPGITLIGPIGDESRVEIDISVSPGSLRTLRIAGRTRTITGDTNNGSEINNDPFRIFGWEAELPLGRGRQIEVLIRDGVKWAGFIPADKAEEFAEKSTA